MDRNSVTGFLLLIGLLIGYVVYNNYEQKKYLEQKHTDSVANAKVHPKPLAPVAAAPGVTPATDSLNDSIQNSLPAAYRGQAQTVVLQNKDLAVGFSTKGAYPVSAELKNYRTSDKKPLYLFNGAGNQFSALLPANNNTVATSDLFYTAKQDSTTNGSRSITFSADMGEGKAVHLTYTLPVEGYMMNCNLRLTGMSAATLSTTWQTQALHTEKDLETERNNAQVYYHFQNGDADYFSFIRTEKEKLESPVHWIGYRLQYFSTALVSESKNFSNVTVSGNATSPDKNVVAVSKNTFDLPLSGTEPTANLRWYMGPNHYKTLRSYGIDLDEMVPLGYGMMAFVKYINKGLIIPIFNILSGFISNYGVIIMLMTLIIRLILSFFTYKSYLSSAKMRVLKPEIDELRAKHGDDQQKFSMEQMKLFRTAGVNPLGGCLPTLFQLPILFAMYYFFPSSIELRQEKFLWADDLSTYDSIANLPFNIPFYGDHVSLFTLLMTASSLFLALYNRNMTPQDPNNPMLKWMPYIFPFMLIGVFNKMAAALTFYYFFSNMLSILQQFIIQKYIINEKTIHAQIQENKNKPATPSKWAQKLEEIQKAQMNRTNPPKKN
ncbi:MAG: membrane protein insertase YidC [Sphingobacteriales bacterium]|nr:MAG: membrane protein insertase YidC [Sphingobacteriales bacterium]